MRHRTRGLVGVVIAAVIVVTVAGPASAHAQLESTQPNQSSVLLTSPSQVVLHFGEPVEIDFGSVRVIGPAGSRVDNGGTHHPSGDTHAVAISLPPRLPDGTYVVAWRVISADSHPVQGGFAFQVGTAANASSPSVSALTTKLENSQTSDRTVGVLFGIDRAVLFGGIALLIGAAAFQGRGSRFSCEPGSGKGNISDLAA